MSSGPDVERWGRVVVKCFGRYWQLRDVPASEWMAAAITPDHAGIFPGLVDDDDAGDIFELFMVEPDLQRRGARVAQKALERASGREWHWALNLIREIQGSWTHLNGLMVRDGVLASQVSLSNYLDAAYTVFGEKLKPDDFKAFETRLRRIPGTGFSSRPRMSSREELMGFAAD